MFFKEQKGQSALEYLMTYGWALIVIVIVIAALVFLINPTQSGTEGCTGFQKLPIGNWQISSTGLVMKVTNQTGRTLSNVNLWANFDDGADVNSTEYTGSESFAANAEKDVTLTQALTAGDHTVNITVLYNDGDFDRSATASCKGTFS